MFQIHYISTYSIVLSPRLHQLCVMGVVTSTVLLVAIIATEVVVSSADSKFYRDEWCSKIRGSTNTRSRCCR